MFGIILIILFFTTIIVLFRKVKQFDEEMEHIYQQELRKRDELANNTER